MLPKVGLKAVTIFDTIPVAYTPVTPVPASMAARASATVYGLFSEPGTLGSLLVTVISYVAEEGLYSSFTPAYEAVNLTVPAATRVTAPVAGSIVATASLLPLQVTVAPETALLSLSTTVADKEPASVLV